MSPHETSDAMPPTHDNQATDPGPSTRAEIGQVDAAAKAAGSRSGEKPAARRFGRDALTVAGARMITRGATFLTGIVVARLLGPEGRGLVAALTIPAALAASMAELGTRQATAYHVGRNTYPLPRLVATLMGMLPFASVIAMLAALAYYSLSGLGSYPLGLQLLAIAAIPSSIGTAYAAGVLLGRGKITRFSRANWIPAVIALAFVLIGAWALGWNIYGILIGTALGNAFGFGYALRIVRKEAPLAVGFDRNIMRNIQRLGMTYAVATFALLLLLKVMVLLLSRLSTLTEVGLYAQAAAIAEMLLEVPTMVTSVLFSRAVTATDKEAMSLKVMALARIALLATSVAAIGVGFLAPFVFPLIYGRAYLASATICILLLPGVVALVFFRLLQQDINARGKAWISTAVILPTIMTTVFLGYLLILRYGAIGAAIASSVGYIVAAAAYAFAYARLIGVSVAELMRFRRSDFDQLLRALPLPVWLRR